MHDTDLPLWPLKIGNMLHPADARCDNILLQSRVRNKGTTAARRGMNSEGEWARFRPLSQTPLRWCAFLLWIPVVGPRPSALATSASATLMVAPAAATGTWLLYGPRSIAVYPG